jgi:Fe2+ or Zn2+ uptake regulation protein
VHRPEELTELFRATGRKVTAQRQYIFRALQGDETHPSAESVYESVRAELETISLKTVYQTLHELADLGELHTLHLGTGAVRFDPNVEAHHHHLVCRSCGKVRDLYMTYEGLEVPPGAAQDFDVSSAEVVFRGQCGDCKAAEGRKLLGPGSRHTDGRTRQTNRNKTNTTNVKQSKHT